jgi:hypothetical protein
MRRIATVFSLIAAVFCIQLYADATEEYLKASDYLNQRGEVYLAIYPDSPADLKPLVNDLWIDRIDEGNKVIAYATRSAFEKFLSYDINYEVLIPPCFQNVAPMSDYADYLASRRSGLAKTAAASANWYAYPTYDAYIAIMKQFQTSFPNLAKLDTLANCANTSQGRKVLALKVTNNVNGSSNGKPRFLQTSTVHGDEVLNYMNTLHMIDTLLLSYGVNTRLTNLLNYIEFWFVPLYNPDGTYYGGNSTVQSARRANINNVDLNRNYPCPCGQTGNHALYGLYSSREPENGGVFNLWQSRVFHLSTDLHSGTETVLWPYASMSRRPCDEAWYIWAARRYADTAHKAANNNGYMTSCGGDGIGNIYNELYECHGTSVDYNIFYLRGRNIPMETSITKLLAASSLQTYWNYNKESLVQFYELLLTGIQGTVKNSVTKAPIFHAKINEATHDFDSAYTYADSAGFYLRFILQGTWNLTFSAPGYLSKTVSITVSLVRQITAASVSSMLWDGTDGGGRVVRNGCYVIKATNAAGNMSKSFVMNR